MAMASVACSTSSPSSTASSLSIEANTLPRPRRGKSLAPPPRRLGPPHRPNRRTLTLPLRRHAHPRLRAPHLDLAIPAPAHQVLARGAPVQTHDPARVAGEGGDLLAGRDVVEGDDPGVAAGREQAAAGGEADATDWGQEAREGVREAAGRVAKEIDGAGGMAGGCEGAVGGLD